MAVLRTRAWLSHARALRLILALAFTLGFGFLLGYGTARGGIPFGQFAGAALFNAGLPQEQARERQSAGDEKLGVLREINYIIESEYYRAANVDNQKLVQGAARGMVQALDDPNSVYEPPVERELGDSRWSGRYEGVGLYVDQRDGQMIVTAPVDGGPAASAGLRPGDVVLEVDGRSLNGLPLTEQIRSVRGARGTPVTLTIRREGVLEPLRLTLIRDEIRLISARARLLDNGLGLLRISQFTEGTVEEARTGLISLLEAHPPGIVLDLRSNGGGLLEPAVKVAGLFLGGGPVVLERHADGEQRTYNAPDGEPLTDIPMLVLVDRGSASAAEVMAAALRDRGRATLVGERTYGKNTVQYIHRLSDGSGLRLTVAEWHTPSGQLIPSTGLDPDVPVQNQTNAGRDVVLETATQHLMSSVMAGQQR